MTTKEVLIIVGDATETVDTLYPYYRLIEAGMRPVVAAPEKRRYQMVLHEVKPGWTITKEWEGYSIEAEIAFRDIVPENYAGILFSGGRAPEYIRYDPDLIRTSRWRASATVLKYPRTRTVFEVGGWRPCPSAVLTWKFAAGFLLTNRV